MMLTNATITIYNHKYDSLTHFDTWHRKAHIQSKGWVDYGTITKDTIIGTVGEKKRIECLCFEGDFEYRVHIQSSGWTDWTKADGVATLGTVGQELRIEAIQFR